MHSQLLYTDRLMIGNSLFVSIINPFKTVVTDPTVEFAIRIVANELKCLSMLEAGIVAHVHYCFLMLVLISLLKVIIYFNLKDNSMYGAE